MLVGDPYIVLKNKVGEKYREHFFNFFPRKIGQKIEFEAANN